MVNDAESSLSSSKFHHDSLKYKLEKPTNIEDRNNSDKSKNTKNNDIKQHYAYCWLY